MTIFTTCKILKDEKKEKKQLLTTRPCHKIYIYDVQSPAPPVTDCFKIAKTALPFALCER